MITERAAYMPGPRENTSNDDLITAGDPFHDDAERLIRKLIEVRKANATAMSAVEVLGDLTALTDDLMTIIEPFVATLVARQKEARAPDARPLPPRLENIQTSLADAISDAATLYGTFLREIKAFK